MPGTSMSTFLRLPSALAMLIGLCVFTTEPSNAQVIGFKIGPTFANISEDDNAAEEGTLTSFGGGGFIRFGLAGLGVQLEVLAVTRGAELDVPGDEDLQIKIDYVDLPLLARYNFGTGSFAPYVMAGPTLSFELSCNIEIELLDPNDEFECSEDEVDRFNPKSTDIGLTGVLGFEYRLGPGAILVEGRYTHGLTDITETGTNARNRMFAIFAGYSISLRGL